MPALKKYNMVNAAVALGNAEIFVSPWSGASGGINGPWSHLGALEGDRTFEVSYSENPLTLPESTGGAPHQMFMNIEAASINGEVVITDETVWAKINPFGLKSGGFSNFRKPKEYAVALVPHADIGDEDADDGFGELFYDTANNRWSKIVDGVVVTGAAAAPRFSVWFWRATISHSSVPYGFADGFKKRVGVTIRAMFYGPAPEGAKVYHIGDPYSIPLVGGGTGSVPVVINND